MIDSRPEAALLDAYVADLERRLSAADPGERADIVASVREHVEADLAGLGRPVTAADVQTSLTTLGSVDTVVAAWAPDRVTPVAPAPAWATATAPAAPPAPLSTRARIVFAVVVVAGIALAVVLPAAWLLLPPALLVLGIMGARRHPSHRAPWIVTAVIGGVLLIISPVVAGALALMVFSSDEATVDQEPTVVVGPVAPAP